MTKSPLDELRVKADEVWDKIKADEVVTTEELMDIVVHERSARAAWAKKEEAKEQ